MPYQAEGHVYPRTYRDGPYVCVEIPWSKDGTANLVQYINVPQGVIDKIVAHHSAGGAGTYDVTLLDDYGIDWLHDNGLACAVNTTENRDIFEVVSDAGDKWARDIAMHSGLLRLVIAFAAGATYGVLKLLIKQPATPQILQRGMA